jgi:diaminopropionate ammonia-lyase
MGRLDCKEPSIVAWQSLEQCRVIYTTVSDDEASLAAVELERLGVATTPSGAAGFAAMNKLRLDTKVNDEFRPLIIASEGPA